MFGWVESLVDRLAAGLFRRGQALAETEDRALEERRTAVRSVRDAISEAMTHAEDDREHGRDSARSAAVAAANRASAVAQEVADDDARRLVLEWKTRFDATPRGWREQGGYPEPAWSELRAAADAAHDQLGVVLRDLLDRRK